MSTNPTNVSATGLSPGDKLDKYEIVDMIGQGGVSIVWKGYDSLLDRHVAIKQLTLGADTDADDQESLRETFRSEAAILKRIASEQQHLVQVIDFIDEPRGLFIVMEFIDGASIEQMLEVNGKPLEQRQTLGIIAATCVALDYIHKQDIVHRDLKPANIMLPRAGGLKVCDFGLATIMADQDVMNQGTVRYMAPECFSGDKIDGKADIYSVGLIAYEMLAGREKFNEAFKIVLRDQRNQAMRWMKWHTNVRATAPALSSLNPAIPETLSELVSRMIEKEPVKRIGSAEELMTAIRRHFVDQTETPDAAAIDAASGVATTAAATAKLEKKSKLKVILAAFLLIQVLIGLGMWAISEKKKSDVVAEARKLVIADFDEAKTLLIAKDWAAARDGFEEHLEDKQLGKYAQAFTMWANANINFNERNFDETIVLCDQLKDLDEMKKRLDDVRRLRDKASRADSFFVVFDRIKEKVDDGDYDGARHSIAEVMETMSLLEDEKAELESLRNLIEGQDREAYILRALQNAKRLIEEGRRVDAVDVLSKADKERSDRRLRDMRARILKEDRYNGTVLAAKQAEQSGDLAEAIRNYVLADEINSEQKFTQKVRLLKSDVAAEAGQKLENDGKLPAAQAQYLLAKGLNPQNQVAIAGLSRIKLGKDFDSLIGAGNAALAAGEYEAAIQHFEEAKKIRFEQSINDKIRSAKIRITVNKGRALFAQDKKEEALQVLNSVSDDSDAANLISRINTQIQYETLRDKGDGFFKESKYVDAKRWYRKARDVKGISAEQKRNIQERLEEGEYAHTVVMSRRAVGAGNMQVAIGHLAGMRKTNEVVELLKTCQAKLRAGNPTENEEIRTMLEQVNALLAGIK